MLEQIGRELLQLRSSFDQKLGEARALRRQQHEVEAELEGLEENIQNLQKVGAIIQKLTTDVQENFLKVIETLISDGLFAVFGTQIQFKITPTTRNSQVTLDFKLINENGTETDIVDARGGGLLAVCGVLFRLLMVRLLKGRVRQVVVLDEALAMLSSEYRQQAGELLAKLTKELDIQIILVSHQTEINEYADTQNHLVAKNGAVTVK